MVGREGGGGSNPTGRAVPAGGGLPERIGKYQVRGLLGAGAQGSVYLAHDPYLDIDVAVKCLTGEVSEESLRRFWEDAKLLARLTHSNPNANIVGVKDYNPEFPFIVMDYCEGGDLNRLIKSRQRLPLTQVIEIVRSICQGLMVAHEQPKPIIHRDLKPGNVLFHRGVAKVADFGLGKQVGGDHTAQTTTRGMMGTIRYTSPEQAEDARKVDARTDIWALGVILYEMLSWGRPFDRSGDTYLQIAVKLQTQPPRPLPFSPPAALAKVVDRALQKDRTRRFVSAREMDEALEAALATVPNAESLLFPPESVLTDLDRLAAEASRCLTAGDAEGAQIAISALRQRDNEHSLTGYWSKRVQDATHTGARSSAGSRDTASRIALIESLIAGGDLEEARQRVGALLRDQPQLRDGRDLLLKINAQERVLEADIEQARSEERQRRSVGDADGLVQVWSALAARYPSNRFILNAVATAEAERELAQHTCEREQVARQAAQAESSGQIEAAIEIWTQHLRKFPHDAEAATERARLRGLISISRPPPPQPPTAAVETQLISSIPTATAREIACAEAADLGTADGRDDVARRRLVILRGAFPEELAIVEALQRLDAKRVAQAEQAESIATDRRVRRTQALLASGRLSALTRERGELQTALDAALQAPPADRPAALIALNETLGRVRGRVDAERAARRDRLLGLTDTVAASPTLRQQLAGELERGLRAVALDLDESSTAEPLAALERAAADLDQGVARISAANAREASSLGNGWRAAERAASDECAALLRDFSHDDPAQRRPAQQLSETFERLRRAQAAGPDTTTASAIAQARAIHAQAAAWRLDRQVSARQRLRQRLVEAQTLALTLRDSALLSEAQKLAAALTDRAATVETLNVAGDTLAKTVAQAKASRTQAESTTAQRWASARTRWQAIAPKVDPQVVSRATRNLQRGEQAQATGDLQGWGRATEELTALVDRQGQVAIWEPLATAVRQLAAAPESAATGALRRTLASADPQALAAALQAATSAAPLARSATSGTVATKPPAEIDARTRAANAVAHPEALRRYDQALAAFKRAGGAAEALPPLIAARHALIDPAPGRWPKLALAAAVPLLALALLPLLLPHRSASSQWAVITSPVALLTFGNDQQISAARRDGAVVAELQRTINDETVDLPAGHYQLELAGGRRVEFDVPSQPYVVLGTLEAPALDTLKSALQAGGN